MSVLIYDQTCAAEKRRRRKKGEYPKAKQRVFINEAVCEGCGDCGVQSNCTSILPVETEFGRKRAIDQSSCNQDYSCIQGFCPSFVTVEGGTPRKSRAGDQKAAAGSSSPSPNRRRFRCKTAPYNILITGIGGTGVITIGALLGMAAHLEGKGSSALDMTGMSQKNGAVTSHVRIAPRPEDIQAQRIATGEADLILGCDMLTAGAHDAISKTRPGRTVAVINTYRAAAGPIRQKPRLAVSGRADPRADRRVRRRALALPERDPPGHGAHGRFDRHESVHARLCIPEGAGPVAGESRSCRRSS